MGRKAKIRKLRKSVANESDAKSEMIQKFLSEMPAEYKDMFEELQGSGLNSSNVVIEPPGPDQTSEIIFLFIEPMISLTRGKFDRLKGQLIDLGILAWNCSFFEQIKRKRMITESLKEIVHLQDKEDLGEMVELVNFTIGLKEQFFNEYQRFIIDYNVKYEGEKLKIDVASIDYQEEGNNLKIYVSSMDKYKEVRRAPDRGAPEEEFLPLSTPYS
ncbi:MAG: hypothetical protein AB4352_03830 [Hormoscilla sp.]